MRTIAYAAAFATVAALTEGFLLPPMAFAQEQPGQAPPTGPNAIETVVVTGLKVTGVLNGMVAEDGINELDIAAYGDDTVGDLLDDIAADVDNSREGPVVLVNGQPSSANDISDLPAEAVHGIQLMPREAAALLGESPERRVINVELKTSFEQITAALQGTVATVGKGQSASANGSVVQIEGDDRFNLAVQARRALPLLEADRGIVTATAGTPYDLRGNVLSWPVTGQEIDPALSALAGVPVTVAGVPAGSTNPSLAMFAANANTPNVTDLGRYRSLIPEQQSYSVNGSWARRLGPRTNFTLNLHGSLSDSDSRIGPPSVRLQVPATSPYSPFSSDVMLAQYLAVPLRQSSRFSNGGAALNFIHGLGTWSLAFAATYSYSDSQIASDSRTDIAGLQAGIVAGSIDPFAPTPLQFLRIAQIQHSASHTNDGTAQLVLTGSPFSLPAGFVTTALRVGGAFNRQGSRSDFGGVPSSSAFARDEVNGQVTVDIPIASRDRDVLAFLGELRLNFVGGLRNVTTAGTLKNYGYGFNWSPLTRVNLHGSVTAQEDPPAPEFLNDPLVAYDNVPYYDFINSETVNVTVLTGGNSALPTAKQKIFTLGFTASPFAALRLDLIGDYTRTELRDTVSGLPPLNAEVEAAYPDRFLRDASGHLVLVDVRPVSFARDDRDQLRWGFNFATNFGPPMAVGPRRLGVGDSALPPVGAWRLDLSLFDTWILHAERQARAGLPVVDLLNGGAAGYGGGLPPHAVQFNAGVTGEGLGVQATGVWKDATLIRSGLTPSGSDLHFSPRAILNLKIFGDLGTLAPDHDLAKGSSLTLSVNNLLDSQQRVRDGNGVTPLSYQPYRLDPLGRTITLELRSTF
jgi:hypothetical protein